MIEREKEREILIYTFNSICFRHFTEIKEQSCPGRVEKASNKREKKKRRRLPRPILTMKIHSCSHREIEREIKIKI